MGRPTVLSPEEEEIMVERMMVLAEWGYPLTIRALQELVKNYLDRMGKTTRNLKIIYEASLY